jgi:hypothetical protein
MPFWMAGSALLNLLLLLPFEHLNPQAWRLAAIAFAIQVLANLVFAGRARADQQPHHQMDAAVSAERLESARAALGRLSLGANMLAVCRARAADCERDDPLKKLRASANGQAVLLRWRRHDAIQPQAINHLPVVIRDVPHRNNRDAELGIRCTVLAIHALRRVFFVNRP